MNAEAHTDSQTDSSMSAESASRTGLSLRFMLSSGGYSIPLYRLFHLAGYATLAGEPEDYFLGWLTMRGDQIPVFDLNKVVNDEPTPISFGSRIMVVRAGHESPHPYIGLVAAGITDTVAADDPSLESLDLDMYLPMLYSLMPPVPAEDAGS